MKFAYAWLLDYLDTELSAVSVVDGLSRLGIEAELLPCGPTGPEAFVVVGVDEAVPHPSADKLRVCKVSDGENFFQIVCGASNVRGGMLTVMARVGAVIPKNGAVIAEVNLRGVKSCGMLCSADELGVSYGVGDSGIVDLRSDDYKVGDGFFLPGPVIEVSVTPNRGDCLGLYGIARELASAGLGTLKPLPEINDLRTFGSSPISAKMLARGLFAGRYVQSINNAGCSPRWIRDRLASAGIRTISCVVDIVNYVMLVLNRPMHVYNADKIRGGELVVDRAAVGKFTALDGKECALDADLVVRDGDGTVHCIAGVIGSSFSECTVDSKNIFLESAWYDPVEIAMSSKRLKLSTESSYRFERFVDPQCVEFGLALAAHMITKYCGGKVSDPVICGEVLYRSDTILFHPSSVSDIGNVAIGEKRIFEILTSLGFSVDTAGGQKWKVSVPSWRRADVKSAFDLVEEVLRVHGYDEIREDVVIPDRVGRRQFDDIQRDKLCLAMLSSGLVEVVTWSFMSSALAKKLGCHDEDMYIDNPVSGLFDMMRTTMLPNLLQVAATNQACGCDGVAVFELGEVYATLSSGERAICGVRSGDDVPRNPHVAVRKYDFFDAKSDVVQVFLQLGIDSESVEFKACSRGYMHPNRSADIYFLGVQCGYVGELHPEYVSMFELKYGAACFEVFLSRVPDLYDTDGVVEEDGFAIHKYQQVKRDFAFVLDKDLQSKFLVDVVKRVPSVEEVRVFDVYRGGSIPEDKVSIAIAVVMSSKVGTMTEQEIQGVSERIVSLVAEKLDGKLRVS
ncbi:MAG: phenylalanine--tRNA ligase subunit beta [Anaplasma sp.]